MNMISRYNPNPEYDAKPWLNKAAKPLTASGGHVDETGFLVRSEDRPIQQPRYQEPMMTTMAIPENRGGDFPIQTMAIPENGVNDPPIYDTNVFIPTYNSNGVLSYSHPQSGGYVDPNAQAVTVRFIENGSGTLPRFTAPGSHVYDSLGNIVERWEDRNIPKGDGGGFQTQAIPENGGGRPRYDQPTTMAYPENGGGRPRYDQPTTMAYPENGGGTPRYDQPTTMAIPENVGIPTLPINRVPDNIPEHLIIDAPALAVMPRDYKPEEHHLWTLKTEIIHRPPLQEGEIYENPSAQYLRRSTWVKNQTDFPVITKGFPNNWGRMNTNPQPISCTFESTQSHKSQDERFPNNWDAGLSLPKMTNNDAYAMVQNPWMTNSSPSPITDNFFWEV